jgi:branched-chain amino acid aminotransferase
LNDAFRNSHALRWNAASDCFEEQPYHRLSWDVDDQGTLFGAILVERFRTFAGRLIEVQDRIDRIRHGASVLGFHPQFLIDDFHKHCDRLLVANRELLASSGDLSVVILMSPGKQGLVTCMLHVSPLPFDKLAHWYQHGTSLVSTPFTTVASSSWPTSIKTRSRLPYLLSDRQGLVNPFDLPLLTTPSGTIADTAVSNILIVDEHGFLFTPPSQDVLFGCSLKLAIRLLGQQGLEVVQRDLRMKDLVVASEVILTGSSGGVWRASSIDGMPLGQGSSWTILNQLTTAWNDHVGLDLSQQANEFKPK